MKLILKILWKIFKVYVIASLSLWAFVGIGTFADFADYACDKNNYEDIDGTVHRALLICIRYAYLGIKRLF